MNIYMSHTAILICALILSAIYILIYRRIKNIVKDSISEGSTIFNAKSSIFYQLLVLAPIVALFDQIMRFFGVMGDILDNYIDWTSDTTVFSCIIIACVLWYIIATKKLISALFWASVNPDENRDSLKRQVKLYVIISTVISTLALLWLIPATILNPTYYLYPYSWFVIAAIVAINFFIFKIYPTQKPLLGFATSTSKKQEIKVASPANAAVADKKPTKRCPYCGEEILAVAKKCKHCGEWLTEKQ